MSNLWDQVNAERSGQSEPLAETVPTDTRQPERSSAGGGSLWDQVNAERGLAASQAPAIERLDQPTGGDSYWSNPITVAMHYNGITADTTGIDWGKFGIDAQFVTDAYNHFSQANQGKAWWEWHSLDATDPYLQTLRGATAPPKEAQYGSLGFQWSDVFGDATPEGLQQTQTQPTMGVGMAPSVPDLNPEQLAKLPYWQQLAYRATTSPLLQGASQMFPAAIVGGAMGLAVGGPLGAIVGAASPLVLGAGLGAFVDPKTNEWMKQRGLGGEWFGMAQQAGGKALEWAGLPGQWAEQGIGAGLMLAEPNIDYLGDVLAANITGNTLAKTQAAIERDADMRRLMDNLGAVWETGKLTYESTSATWGGTFQQNIPAGIEAAIDTLLTGSTDAKLAGLGYTFRLGQADPVKVDKVGLVALNSALTEVLNGATPETVLQRYQDYFGIGGQMVDLFNQSFADPLNIVPFAESGAIGKVAKFAGNPTLEAASKLAFSRGEGVIGTFKAYGAELRAGTGIRLLDDGMKVPLLPTEYTKFQRTISGVTKTGTIAELTPGMKLNRGIFAFVENPINPMAWLNHLNDLTPQSKVMAVQGQAFENAMLLSNLAGQDVGKAEHMFKAWAEMLPQQAAEVARILGMPEAVTVRQFMSDFVGGKGGLNDISAAWKMGEGKRAALAKMSSELGESVGNLVRQIEIGDLTAEILRERLIARTPSLASDAKFTPEALKGLISYFKENWWAAHPEFYKAHMRNVLMDKVINNAIKAFGVKPGSALERVSMSIRSLQNIILLNLNPAYLINNIANNIVMQAYEGVFGMKRQSTISKDFQRLLGTDPFRLREGVGPADGTLDYKVNAAVAEDVQKLRKAGRGTDWTQSAVDFTQAVNRKLSGVQNMSANLEGQMSAQAMHAGVFRSLPYIKELLAPAMDPALTAALDRIGVNPDRLRAVFTSARSVEDIERILTGELPNDAAMFVPEVARALGMESARVTEMLEGSGVLQELNKRLSLGQPIDEAMSGLDTDLRKWMSDRQQQDIISHAEDVANRIQSEGMGATFDVLFDIFERIETEWTRHMADLDATYEYANKQNKSVRRDLIAEAMQAEKDRFDQLGAWVRGTYSGVLEGMRFDPALRETFALQLDDYYSNWQSFFTSRDAVWKGFATEMAQANLRPGDPEYQAARLAVQQELGRLYDAHGLKEREVTGQLGGLFSDMVGRQLGEGFRPAAQEYFDAQNTAQDVRRQVMSDFRAWERGDPQAIQTERVRQLVEGWTPDRAHALWPQFHERVYVPVVGEYIQAGYDGLMRLHREMNGETVTRTTRGPEEYAARLAENRANMPQPAQAVENVAPVVVDNTPTVPEPLVPAPAGMTDLPPGTPPMPDNPFMPTPPEPIVIPQGFTRGGEILQAINRAFPDMSMEQKQAYFDLIEARARAWGKQNGRPSADYYQRFADMRRVVGPGEPIELGQGLPPRGAVDFLSDGRAIITAFQSADVSTLSHELGHVFRRDLGGDDVNVAAEWSGATRDEGGNWVWNREAEEKFADGFVKYLEEGRAPTSQLRGVFEKFKGWLLDLYQTVRGRQDIQMDTSMRGVFDRLLSDHVDEIANKFAGKPQHLGQMDEGALSDMGWKGGRKHLLNSVNADRRAMGLESYKTFNDVPWHEAQASLYKRNPTSAVGIDRFAFTPVSAMPEWLKPLVNMAADRIEEVYLHGEAGKRIYTDDPDTGHTRVTSQSSTNTDEYINLNVARRDIPGIIRKIKAGEENLLARSTENIKRDIWGLITGGRTSIDPTDLPYEPHIGAMMWAGMEQDAAARFSEWFYNEGGNQLDDAGIMAQIGDPQYLDWLLENAPVPGDTLFQRGAKPVKGQMGMFDQTNADLPLFSGTAQRGQESVFNPQPVDEQGILPGFEAPKPEMFGAKPGEDVKPGQGTLFQSSPDQGELAAIGPMLPGSMHSQGTAPFHEGLVHGEAYDNYVRPVLNELRRAMSGRQVEGAKGALDANGMDLLNQWVVDAKQAHGQATLGALRMGEMYRDAALLNYGRRYNYDGLLSMVFPYQFFATRTMTNWAMRVMDKPAILSWFARIAGLQKEQENKDLLLPSRLRGKMFMPMPFLPDWMGDGLFIDPLGKLFPFRDQMRPYEQMIMSARATDNKATDLLKEWAKNGEINPDQAQTAMTSKSGALWERAMAMAQSTDGGDWTDMASLFVSPALYLTVPYKLATGQTEDIGPYPPSRMIQALSAATGIKGLQNLDFEAQWKKNAGLSPYGKWGDYYIDRQLVNLVADGVIDAKAAQAAMIERSGTAYEQAVARVQQELMFRSPGALPIYTAGEVAKGKAGLGDLAASLLLGWIPANILPEGEMKLRGLSGAYSQAWTDYKAGDKKAIDKFLTAHPEFKARTALYAEPEERLRNFLVSEVWDRFSGASSLDRRNLPPQLGDDFELFLNGKYDTITNDTLASWAQALGGMAPGMDVKAADVTMAAPDLAQLYDQYRTEMKQLFPNIGDYWTEYYKFTKGSRESKQYWKDHPMLGDYMDWKEQYLAKYPELEPAIKSTDKAAEDTSAAKVYAEIKAAPGLLSHVQAAQFGERLSKGSTDMLKNIWERNGKPEGDFNSWLASIGVPGY